MDEIIPLETNKEKLGHLQNMRRQAQSMFDALSAIRTARDLAMPEFRTKFSDEVRRSAIIDELSGDRFSQDKYNRLKDVFPGLFEEPVVLAFAAGIVTGEQRHMAGLGGRPTHRTPVEILDAYFRAHPGGEISLSSLIPEPGEDKETIEAKMALSALLAKIPSKQSMDPIKTFPAMLMPHSGGLLRLFPVLSRSQNGNFDFTIGPNDAQGMRDATDPLYRFYYGVATSLAMSASMNPRMYLSAQLHMLMMNSPKGQRYISEQLASDPSGQKLKFNTVSREDVKEFIRYVKEEMLPQLQRNPRLAMQVAFLLSTNRIKVNLVDYNLDALLVGLPSGEFELTDSFSAEKMEELSKVLEAVLKVSEEINRTRAAEEIEDYPMSYFDPLRAIQDASISYNSAKTEIIPPRHVLTISYDSNQELKPGEVIHRGMALETVHDTVSWMSANIPEIPERFVRQMVDGDPFGDFLEALEKSGAFALNFLGVMPRTISAGFNDFWGGFGDLLRASETKDKKLALEAVSRMKKALADTTGGFVVFESMPFTFFSDVIKDIENGDFIAAITSSLVIYKLTGVSLGLLGQAVKSGVMIPVKTGVFIYNSATGKTNAWLEYKKAMAIEIAGIQQHTQGRVGIRLAKWATGIGLAHDAYAAGRGTYRYLRGNLSASISPSAVEIELDTENRAGEARRGPLSRAADWGTKYRSANQYWGVRSIHHAGTAAAAAVTGVVRSAVEVPVGRIRPTLATASAIDPAISAPIEASIAAARVNPQFVHPLTIPGSATPLTIDARTYFQLAESVNPAQTKAILEQFCLASKTQMPKVNADQLHAELSSLRQVFAEGMTLGNLQLARTNPNATFDVTLAKGNNKPTTITLDAATYLELSQAQTVQETRAIVKRYNSNPNHTQKFSMRLASIQEIFGVFENARSTFSANAAQLMALSPSGNVFSPFEFLRGLTEGRGFDDTFKIKTRNPVTGQVQVVEVTGRQILEILNRQVNPTIVPGRRNFLFKQTPVISLEIDAAVSQRFRSGVKQKAFVKMVKTAYAKVNGVFGLFGRKALAISAPVPPTPGTPAPTEPAPTTPPVDDGVAVGQPDPKPVPTEPKPAEPKPMPAEEPKGPTIKVIDRRSSKVPVVEPIPSAPHTSGPTEMGEGKPPVAPEPVLAPAPAARVVRQPAGTITVDGVLISGNINALNGISDQAIADFAAELKGKGVKSVGINGTHPLTEADLLRLPNAKQLTFANKNPRAVILTPKEGGRVVVDARELPVPQARTSKIPADRRAASRKAVRAERRAVQAARTTAAPGADPIVVRFESAKAAALARLEAAVERGVIPRSEAAARKAIAAKAWDRQIAELRQPQPGKKPGMLQNQGSIAAIMLGIAVLQHLDEIKRGEFGGAVKDGLISVGTLKLIGVADEALKPLLLSSGLSKAASGLVGGGIIGAGVALIHNREALFSSSSNARGAALVEVANEGALGAVSAGVGMKVGEVVSSTLTPWVGVPVGFLSGLGTYYLLKEGLEKDLGYAKWVMREMSSGQIEDSLSELRVGGMLLRVEDKSTDTPYFTAETESFSVGGKKHSVSKAQASLAFLKGIEDYRSMSDAQRVAFKAQTRPKPGVAGSGDVYEYVGTALDGISRLEVPSYEDLNETALVQIAKAVHQFRGKGTYRNVQVRLEREVVEEIKHPITGQVVGQKVKYHVAVRGREEVLTTEGYQFKDKAFRKEVFTSEDMEVNGDQQEFSEAIALRQSQSGNSFNISLADVIVSDMRIPFNQLHRFPKVMAELASALMLLGYDPTVYGVNSETVAYTNESVSMALEDYMEQSGAAQRSVPGMSGPIPVLRLRMEGPKVLEPKMLRGVFQSLQGIASKEPRV
ncbi:MAG: hypothetical protein WCV91_05100 [Candidatus Margulisiibacteriota bacterium]